LAGCTDPPAPRCQNGFIGDAKLAPEVQMLVTDGKSKLLAPVADGDTLPMEPPPQGGFILYIGAAARNLDGCGVQLAGSLRDPDTGAQVGFDGRNTDLVKGDDGWSRSDPGDNSNTANVNSCPDYTSKDRHNGEYDLVLKVTDRQKRTASVTHRVKLACDPSLVEPGYSECVCTCSADYFLGKCNGFSVDLGR
jgi:hypothetical protein